jgi:nucleoside-diphosphate-sugar epimerase
MNQKVVVTGGAGLVGQNLLSRLTAMGYTRIVALDKHPTNTAILQRYNPMVRVLQRDLAGDDVGANNWSMELAGCHTLVIAHAQIGGTDSTEFTRNNIQATERVVEAALRHNVAYVINISSSVVNSMAKDDYSETKKAQEALVVASGIKQVVLRPTLMFGWFDRKHLGWLARFMKKVPIFPVPGSGRYLRQPLFAGDFCNVIQSSIEREITGAFNITGMERIDYIDLIRAVKQATGAKTHIQPIPYGLFWAILRANAIFDRDPAFTVSQLEALVTPDLFEVIDWPGIFSVRATPLQDALNETFRHSTYSDITLDF